MSCADVPTAPENARPSGKTSSSSIDDNDVRWFLLHSRHILVGQPRVWKVCKGGPQGKIFNGETKDLGNCGLAGNVNSLPIAVVARVRVSPHSNNFTLNWEESGGGTLASHAMNNRAVRGQRARILENDPYVDGNEPLWFTSKGRAYFALCGGNPSPVGYGVEGTPDEPRGWAEWLKFIENKDDKAKAYFNCAPGIGNNSSNRARVVLKGKTFTASMTYRVSDNPAARDQWLYRGRLQLCYRTIKGRELLNRRAARSILRFDLLF